MSIRMPEESNGEKFYKDFMAATTQKGITLTELANLIGDNWLPPNPWLPTEIRIRDKELTQEIVLENLTTISESPYGIDWQDIAYFEDFLPRLGEVLNIDTKRFTTDLIWDRFAEYNDNLS